MAVQDCLFNICKIFNFLANVNYSFILFSLETSSDVIGWLEDAFLTLSSAFLIRLMVFLLTLKCCIKAVQDFPFLHHMQIFCLSGDYQSSPFLPNIRNIHGWSRMFGRYCIAWKYKPNHKYMQNSQHTQSKITKLKIEFYTNCLQEWNWYEYQSRFHSINDLLLQLNWFKQVNYELCFWTLNFMCILTFILHSVLITNNPLKHYFLFMKWHDYL